MDLADQAQELEQRLQAAQAQAALGRRLATLRRRDRGPEHCRDCGEEIEEARRRVEPGAWRCIECQRASEGG